MFGLFFIIPTLLAFNFHPGIKLGMVLLGLSYIVVIALKLKMFSREDLFQIKGRKYVKYLGIIFICIVISTWWFVDHVSPENLFVVVKKSPLLWLLILAIYALFSAYPQEIIYRGYFFKRYGNLFGSQWVAIGLNLIAFPAAHLVFHNNLVLVVTFIGGALFTLSYFKTNSILLTTIEHALYGNWLFTIGMGEMLAFPMPQ